MKILSWALTLLTSSALAVASLPAAAQTYTVLHEFAGTPDGSLPNSGAITDAAGNIYTVTQAGGSANTGALFKIDPAGDISTLYSFSCTTGCDLYDNPLALARSGGSGSGTLYGTTLAGGANNAGVVYSVKTDGSGYTVLHAFDGKDGFYAGFGTLQFTSNGGLVGITAEGAINITRLTISPARGCCFPSVAPASSASCTISILPAMAIFPARC